MKEGKNIPIIANNAQYRTSEAWIKLCAIIDKIAAEGKDSIALKKQLKL